MEDSNRQSIIVIFCVIVFLIFVTFLNNSENSKNNAQEKMTQEHRAKIPLNTNLTTTQIDKICITSLSEINGNPISNYIKVSSDISNKKYVYQSKETLYKYSCGFTGNDTFYVNGEGWQDIIPRGILYTSSTKDCINFDLYDPAFKSTHNFTVCDEG